MYPYLDTIFCIVMPAGRGEGEETGERGEEDGEIERPGGKIERREGEMKRGSLGLETEGGRNWKVRRLSDDGRD
jgi:hypothetical protein